MGDLATPVAFELARALKRPPRVMAQESAAAFPRPPWLARGEAAGAGYLNLFLDRGAALRALAREMGGSARPVREPRDAGSRPSPTRETIIVEHTNINPNKAA